MAEKPFKDLKGDERRWRIESAANALKEYAKIRNDKPLLDAAREELKRQIKNSQTALKS